MNPWIPAISALTGSIVGGLISFIATYILKSREWKNDSLNRELSKRETLYSEFMAETSRLLLLAIDQKARNASEFSKAVDLLMRIRMTSSDEVINAAEMIFKKSTEKHSSEDRKKEEGKAIDTQKSGFTKACRRELEELKKKG